MLEFFSSETSWLTMTNIALGAVTLACLIAVARTAIMELADRARAKAGARAGWQDDHAFVFSDLGITMADGGEPIDEWERKSRKPSGEKDEPEHPASGPQ